jgi:hypothetical protein
MIWTNIGHSGTMEAGGRWKIRPARREPVSLTEDDDEAVLLPAGGTANNAQAARPTLRFRKAPLCEEPGERRWS